MARARGSSRRARSRHRPEASINVTPFVDVMLVLLVVFMVTAPMMNVGVPVNLPDSQAELLPQTNEPPVSLSVDDQGRMFLQTEPVAEAELGARLDALMADRDSRKVYIHADGQNSYAKVFEVMGWLSAAGYNDIGLVGDVPAREN